MASIATGGSLEIEGGMAATGEAIWVRAPDPFLVRIDPATNEVVDTIDTVRSVVREMSPSHLAPSG